MPLQVTPKNISLRALQTQVFCVDGNTQAVTWSIRPRCGRIDVKKGVYKAPFLIPRNANVTVQAEGGDEFDTANVILDPGWFWLHFLGVYWAGWAGILLIVIFWGWERLCPNCRPADLLISPPLATVTASQAVRFTATAPVTWQDNLNSSGLYNAPAAQPPNPSINITATAIADAKKTASASLIWSPDIGVTLEPQQTMVFDEGKDIAVSFNPVITVAPDKQGAINPSTAVTEWLQPPIGKITNGTYTVKSGEIKRAATIMIMANVRIPPGPPRTAGTYLTLLPKSPAKACEEDGIPSSRSLIALIALAGALGGLIHGASSFAVWVGKSQFKSTWTWWYVLRPVLGAAVAVVVYLVVRSGLGTADMSLLGADCLKNAGFAGLIGMFAEPAMAKLKEIFDTIFAPKPNGRVVPKPPRIDSLNPTSVSSGTPAGVLRICGADFEPGCVVKIGVNARPPRSFVSTLLDVDLQPYDVASPGDVPVRVCNSLTDSDCSNTVNLKVTVS
jgi:hypothetical protein